MMSIVLEAGKISPTWSSLLLEKIQLAPLPLPIRGGLRAGLAHYSLVSLDPRCPSLLLTFDCDESPPTELELGSSSSYVRNVI